MEQNQTTRCVNCVLPKSTFNIKFDENGSCELCNNDLSNWENDNIGDNNLEYQIQKIKELGKNKPYDCLVGLSGGRDSSYLLYLLVKKHNLRCMAAYHRTPFTPDIIDNNVKMLTKKLNVPLIQMDISIEKHKLFTKRMINSWIKTGDMIFANIACAPCKQHNHDIYKIAKRHSIPTIVFGGNKLEKVQFSAGQSKNIKIKQTNKYNLLQKLKMTGIIISRGISVLIRQPQLIKDFPILFKASILHLNNSTLYLRMRYSKIHMFNYYYFANYDENAVIKFLSDIGWEIPENCNSTWRADCSFNEIKNYIFKQEMGATYTDAFLSNSIRAGTMSREEALKRAKIEGEISYSRINEVCNILEIPSTKFHKHKN